MWKTKLFFANWQLASCPLVKQALCVPPAAACKTPLLSLYIYSLTSKKIHTDNGIRALSPTGTPAAMHWTQPSGQGRGLGCQGPKLCQQLFQQTVYTALLFNISSCSWWEPHGMGTISDAWYKKAVHHLELLPYKLQPWRTAYLTHVVLWLIQLLLVK